MKVQHNRSYTAGDDLTHGHGLARRSCPLLPSLPVRGTARKSPRPTSCIFFFAILVKKRARWGYGGGGLNPKREVDSSQGLWDRERLAKADLVAQATDYLKVRK